MTLRKKICFAALIGLAAAPLPAAAPLQQAPFNGLDWEIESVIYWRWIGGKVQNISVGGMVASRLEPGNPNAAAITLKPFRKTSSSGAEAALALTADKHRCWLLALTDDNQTRTAQLFLRDGEKTLKTETAVLSGGDFRWEYNTPYRLKLRLDGGKAVGTVSDAAGAELCRIAADGGEAGTFAAFPALTATTMPCEFEAPSALIAKIRPEDPVPPPRFGTLKYRSPANVSKNFSAEGTGFFRIDRDPSGRYWFIDPDGKALFLCGVDMLTYWGRHCEALGYPPYMRNMDKKFNCNPMLWRDSTLQRLREWGFNFSATTQPYFYDCLPFANIVMIGSPFAALGDDYDICPYLGAVGSALPNPFHPDFPKFCRRRYLKVVGPDIGNPYMVGYFSDNEMRWLGSTRNRDGSCVFDDVMKKHSRHTAKTALVGMLRKHYNDSIAAFNAEWRTSFDSFERILEEKELKHSTPEQLKIKQEFLALVAETYFSTIRRVVKELDPHHLYLGCRFAGFYSTHELIWRAVGRHCDVVTLNMYPVTDTQTRRIWVGEYDAKEVFDTLHRWTGRPLMITEWAYVAFDSGLPCTVGAGQRVDTQRERADCAELFLRWMASRPDLVGVNWFKHGDDPKLGVRVKMGENCNYGLVDVEDRPYEELVSMFARVQSDIDALRGTPVAELRLPKGGALYRRYAMPPRRGETADVTVTPEKIANRRISLVRNAARNRVEYFAGAEKRGELAFMIRFTTQAGRNGYPQIHRIENLRTRRLANGAEMTFTGHFKTDRDADLAMDIRLLLPENAEHAVAEILRVANRGKETVHVSGLYFCPYPAFEHPEQREAYPEVGLQTNLFRKRCAWYNTDNSYFAAASSITRIHFTCRSDGTRENTLSNGFVPLLPRDFAPGCVWTPEDRCYIFCFSGSGDCRNAADRLTAADLSAGGSER